MDKPTKTRVAGIPDGFQELRFAHGDIILNHAAGPDNGLPLLLIPGQMEAWQGTIFADGLKIEKKLT